MDSTHLPPFERIYQQHADAVLGQLRRRLGRQRAEDAFQETFLRALRAYPKLHHADNLGGWLKVIAANVANDELRRGRPASLEPDETTSPAPGKQRAAVVLRYAFDLDYEAIGNVLGSSPEAARQAVSTGIRRLRKETT
jgi:RNA polymerase sigma-70 factor (ECF subfamily)